MKIYLIVAAWENTKNNHAGMFHLAKQIKAKSIHHIKILSTPTKYVTIFSPIYRFLNVIIGLYLRFVCKNGDKVFLMEYLMPYTEQSDMAYILKNKVDVRAIVHFVPSRIEQAYSKKEYRKKISYIDKLYVLGSSLKKYFVSNGINKNKIRVTYHYVDNNYYKPTSQFLTSQESKLKVICMGNMERDYQALVTIIQKCPEIDFHICMGKQRISNHFSNMENVHIYGFMSEDSLLNLMQECDVSLNVMKDTIGSNVITTSLSTGLCVVASNVGSIGDYVIDGESGLLFDTIDEAVCQLKELDKNRNLVRSLKEGALARSKRINIDNFITWFDNEFK